MTGPVPIAGDVTKNGEVIMRNDARGKLREDLARTLFHCCRGDGWNELPERQKENWRKTVDRLFMPVVEGYLEERSEVQDGN